MAENIVKINFFDGVAYRTYEVGKNNVIKIELENIAKVTVKDYEGKRCIFIKSEYMEVFTKNR